MIFVNLDLFGGGYVLLRCFIFYSLSFCFDIQMPVVGRDHLPRGAAMLRRPLPFCAGQLHHGDLYGCWGAASGLVIKAGAYGVAL